MKTSICFVLAIFLTNAISAQSTTTDHDSIYSKVEKSADFPGSTAGWKSYLEKNLDANVPVMNGAPAGVYQVIIKFIVSKDGSLSNITALTRCGYAMEQEAIRVIKKGPRWTPGYQNGRFVNSYRIQPVTFVVSEQ